MEVGREEPRPVDRESLPEIVHQADRNLGLVAEMAGVAAHMAAGMTAGRVVVGMVAQMRSVEGSLVARQKTEVDWEGMEILPRSALR